MKQGMNHLKNSVGIVLTVERVVDVITALGMDDVPVVEVQAPDIYLENGQIVTFAEEVDVVMRVKVLEIALHAMAMASAE